MSSKQTRGGVAPAETLSPMAVAAKKPSGARGGASMLHVRVSDRLKIDASTTLEGIGLTTSEAIRLFLHRVVAEQRLPLDLKVPNAETEMAITEARGLASRAARFDTPQAMFDALEKAG